MQVNSRFNSCRTNAKNRYKIKEDVRAITIDEVNEVQMDKINKLLENYVKSVNECDTELAQTFWDSEEPVSFIHPRGFEHNIDEIKNNFYIGTMGKLFSKRDLRLFDIKAKIKGETAFLEFRWDFYATVKETGENIIHKGRETQFLIMRSGEWKISNIHYSQEPEL